MCGGFLLGTILCGGLLLVVGAMPAITDLTNAQIRFSGEWRVVWLPEAASQTFKANDILLKSSGKVAIAVASGALADTVDIAGFALADATGVTDTLIPVAVPVNNFSLFSLPVYHATPASAKTAITQVGAVYQGERNEVVSGRLVWAVLLSATSNPVFYVVDIDDQFPVTESYGRLWCRFIPGTP